MELLAAAGINSFKFFMAYKGILQVRHSVRCRALLDENTPHRSCHCIRLRTHAGIKATRLYRSSSPFAFSVLSEPQVTDEQLLHGFAKCKELGALPQVRNWVFCWPPLVTMPPC